MTGPFISIWSCLTRLRVDLWDQRTQLIFDGEPPYAAPAEVGGFVSWACQDFVDRGILVEVGFFGVSDLDGIGFILYDGGFTGISTIYEREGLEHTWRWAGTNSNYAFVIQLDGTGLYYDFSGVSTGETSKAKEVYVCKQR